MQKQFSNMWHRRRGSSLIELMVVIVVFVVGILTFVQIFPPGLSILRVSRSNSVATQLADAEMQRITGKSAQLADYIAPVQYETIPGGIRIVTNPSHPTRELMPARDPDPAGGRIREDGQVLVGGQPIGDWQKVSGANLISRVIRESRTVPAPRRIPGGEFGSLLNLTFAPVYYFPSGTGVGEPGVLTIYGNDMVRRWGNRQRNNPNEFGRIRDYEFYYVRADRTEGADPFTDQDQLWIGPARNRSYRIDFSFVYNNGGQYDQYEMIVIVELDTSNPPSYAAVEGNYWVISLPALVAEPDIYGRTLYNTADFVTALGASIDVQRVFQEIPAADPFSNNNPFQYKVLSPNLASIMVNPIGFEYRVNSYGGRQPLEANADYTVFDWRIIRDEFTVPQAFPSNVKLVMNGIQSRDTPGVDGRFYTGLGIPTPDISMGIDSQDFVLQDITTGGIILGNVARDVNPDSAYVVDKTNGSITFFDVDDTINPAAGNRLSAYISYPTGNPLDPWSPPVFVPDISGRGVRALYMATGEWAVQVYKAAGRYRVTGLITASGLQIAECYIGASRTTTGGTVIGDPYRIYFPIADLGQKVVVGEIWYNDGSGQNVIYDQEFQISDQQNVLGVQLAFIDIRSKLGPGAVFDYGNGYAVRRVRGASATVRVLWNPTQFALGGDELENYNRLEQWMRSTRRIETESFVMSGEN